jgi:hypothetical protein
MYEQGGVVALEHLEERPDEVEAPPGGQGRRRKAEAREALPEPAPEPRRIGAAQPGGRPGREGRGQIAAVGVMGVEERLGLIRGQALHPDRARGRDEREAQPVLPDPGGSGDGVVIVQAHLASGLPVGLEPPAASTPAKARGRVAAGEFPLEPLAPKMLVHIDVDPRRNIRLSYDGHQQ